ncbi:MAG: Acyl-CoA dehydrogenase family protein, partial [uncultured Acetobacteraceae bacterium]
ERSLGRHRPRRVHPHDPRQRRRGGAAGRRPQACARLALHRSRLRPGNVASNGRDGLDRPARAGGARRRRPRHGRGLRAGRGARRGAGAGAPHPLRSLRRPARGPRQRRAARCVARRRDGGADRVAGARRHAGRARHSGRAAPLRAHGLRRRHLPRACEGRRQAGPLRAARLRRRRGDRAHAGRRQSRHAAAEHRRRREAGRRRGGGARCGFGRGGAGDRCLPSRRHGARLCHDDGLSEDSPAIRPHHRHVPGAPAPRRRSFHADRLDPRQRGSGCRLARRRRHGRRAPRRGLPRQGARRRGLHAGDARLRAALGRHRLHGRLRRRPLPAEGDGARQPVRQRGAAPAPLHGPRPGERRM